MTQKYQLEKINGFLNKEEHSNTELKIKQRVEALEANLVEKKSALNEMQKALQDLNSKHNNLQQEVLMLAQQLNGVFQVILDLTLDEGSEEDKDEEE